MTVAASVPNATDTRELRALALYRTRGAEIVRTGLHTYEVPSCSGSGPYAVDYERESCDCPDARRHPALNCKHLLAVAVKMAKRRGQSNRHLPDHELIRLNARRHPERSYSEHVEAARSIAGRTYVEDLSRISPAANLALSRDLEAEDRGL
ncbi:MAG: hypothetical protein WKF67_09225 [Rubrobacteraceae bacterium]